MKKFLEKPSNRKYIYSIITALIPLLLVIGVVGPDESQMYLNIAAAVLGLGGAGLAQANVTPAEDEVVEDE